MKIVLAAHTTPQSGVLGMGRGVSGYIYNLALALRKQGHDVVMYIRDDYKPAEDWIRTVHVPIRKWLFYPYWLARALRNESADVFHSDFVSTGVAIAAVKKRPCVVAAHDIIPFEERLPLKYAPLDRVFKARYARIASYADAVIFMSKDAASRAPAATGIDVQKVRWVHNGVDIERFAPIRKQPDGKVKIGYLGGLDGRKNVILLVEAFKRLAARRDDVELHVGGSGTMLQKFRGMNIPNATFHGFVDEEKKAGFYNMLDIFVFPSLMEGFGMMLTEALSCGLPVVGLNRSSTPEIVKDAGVLVGADAEAMASAIERLVDDKKLRLALAKKARARALEMSWDRCAENTLKIYNEVCR